MSTNANNNPARTGGAASALAAGGGGIIMELNVGGVMYHTQLATLQRDSASHLAKWFNNDSSSSSGVLIAPNAPVAFDKKQRYFIDRDGDLFRLILAYLRHGQLDECSTINWMAFRREAEFYGLRDLLRQIDDYQNKRSACITLGYRGTFAFGRDGLADVKFRKLSRILVAGRVFACREVFADTLNDSRDPDMGADDRYSSRFFLKHSNLEQAFEMLFTRGYAMVGSCASGTSASATADCKPGQDTEEHKWQHYNEFVFMKL